MSPYETLLIRKDGPVDWVTMNRPGSLNAMNPKLVAELQTISAASTQTIPCASSC